MTKPMMDSWIRNDDEDRNRDDHVVHRSTSSAVNSSSFIIIFSFSSFAFGSFGRQRKCHFLLRGTHTDPQLSRFP